MQPFASMAHKSKSHEYILPSSRYIRKCRYMTLRPAQDLSDAFIISSKLPSLGQWNMLMTSTDISKRYFAAGRTIALVVVSC